MLSACAALAGCDALRAETVIAPAAARDAVQAALGVTLVEASAISSVAALNDVTATYTARTANERLLLVVFEAREASAQLTGAARPRATGVVVADNVVALYERDPGTISRLAELRAALRELDRAVN